MSHPLDLIRALAHQNHGLLLQLAKDFPEDRLESPPCPSGNDARWVLGHIAVSRDFALTLLGAATHCPHDWASRFGPGSPGQTHGGPGLGILIETLDRQFGALDAAASGVPIARLEKPHGVGFLEGSALRTVGDLVSFLMTTHEAQHLGQLSVCRRAAGFAPIF